MQHRALLRVKNGMRMLKESPCIYVHCARLRNPRNRKYDNDVSFERAFACNPVGLACRFGFRRDEAKRYVRGTRLTRNTITVVHGEFVAGDDQSNVPENSPSYNFIL